MPKILKNKKIAIIAAFKNFRDEEYFVVKEILESAGAEIKTASNKKGVAFGADGGEAMVDFLISEVNPLDFDAIVFIGGPGALENLDNEDSYRLARETILQNKVLGAICVSPVILAKAGVLKNKKATVWSNPLDKKPIRILKKEGAVFQDKPVASDGKIITANGPAASRDFANALIVAIEKSWILT